MTALQGDAVCSGADWEPSTPRPALCESWALKEVLQVCSELLLSELCHQAPTTGYTQVSVGSAAAALGERRENGKIENKELTVAEVFLPHPHP